MNTHTQLSPSASNRWLKCLYSVQLKSKLEQEGLYTDISGPAAEEGSRAHEAAEAILKCEIAGGVPNELHSEYTLRPYLDFCLELARTVDICFIEKKVRITPLCAGTADFVAVRGDHVHVVDLKYGQGLKVHAANNTQLMLYAAGVFNDFPRAKTFTLSIVQPRLEHIDSVTVTVDELHVLRQAVEETERKLLQIQTPNVGAHCQFCPVKAHCVGFLDKTKEIIATKFDNVPVVETIDTERLAHILDHKAALISFLNACEERAFLLLSSGISVKGYTLAEGRENRSWKADAQDVLSTLFGEDLIMSKPELLTVAQVEKAIGKKEFTKFCADLVVRKKELKVKKSKTLIEFEN